MSRKCFILFISLVIVSCASNTGVVQIGEDKLFIAKQAATGFPGTGGIKTEAIKEASKYCTSKNKTLKILELKENEGPYVLGKYPRVEITFLCE
jgi:hypothetical protein